jgi:hypothetical protein
MNKRVEEHSFSIEMKSEQYVRKMSFLDKEESNVFFEGFLGALKGISIVEGVMLQMEGANGVLRVDVTQEELENCLSRKKAVDAGETQ